MSHEDFFQTWDATNEEQMGDFTPIPEGDYLAIATGGEWKPTKNGKGQYLQITLELIQGEHKGRKLWARLNLRHPNSDTVRIAKQELSSICHAVGVLRPGDISKLFNLPMLVTVKLKKREDTGAMTNEIKGYKPKPKPVIGQQPQQVKATQVAKAAKPAEPQQEEQQQEPAEAEEEAPWAQ